MYTRWATHSCDEEDESTFENITRLNAALEKAREYFINMGKVPYVTLSLLTELHSILLPNSHPGLRNTPVYTTYKGRIHVYPDHWTLEEQLHATCDLCNRLISNLKRSKQTNALTLETISEITAIVVFNILSIHPYVDGNGRLCRVIAAYILFLVTENPKVIKDWTPSLVTMRQSIPKSKTTFPIMVDVKPLQRKITKAHVKSAAKSSVCTLY